MTDEPLVLCHKHSGLHRGFIVCRHMYLGADIYVWSRNAGVLHCSRCDCRDFDWIHGGDVLLVCEACLDERFPELLTIDQKFPAEPDYAYHA